MENYMPVPSNIMYFEGNTYELILTPYSWQKAHNFAQNNGGYLAQITSEGENDAVYELAMAQYDYIESVYFAPDGGGASYIWMGGSDFVREGTWKWTDGSSISGYLNWGAGAGVTEPDNFDDIQHYLGMALEPWPYPTGSIGSSGEWNDIWGGNSLWSVVEFDGLIGTAGNDQIIGSNIGEYFYGGHGNDVLSGKNGNDKLYGGNNNDKLYGGNNNDKLYGGNNNDKLYGGSGKDLLKGDAGRDTLQGDAGKDTMFGGAGADTFVFRKTSDSKVKASKADIIKDFTQGKDHIDLHFIDASTKLKGNNAFTFDGTTSFGTSKKGDIYYETFDNKGTKRDYTMVYIDTDSDRGTEMSIKLMGLHNLTADDFIL